jgi:hypothetical protein
MKQKKTNNETHEEIPSGINDSILPIDQEVVFFMALFLESLKNNTAQKNHEIILDINALADFRGININGEGYILPTLPGVKFSGKDILAIYFAAHHYSIPQIGKKYPMAFEREFYFARKIVEGE